MPETGTFLRLQAHKRVEISQAGVHESVGISVI